MACNLKTSDSIVLKFIIQLKYSLLTVKYNTVERIGIFGPTYVLDSSLRLHYQRSNIKKGGISRDLGVLFRSDARFKHYIQELSAGRIRC